MNHHEQKRVFTNDHFPIENKENFGFLQNQNNQYNHNQNGNWETMTPPSKQKTEYAFIQPKTFSPVDDVQMTFKKDKLMPQKSSFKIRRDQIESSYKKPTLHLTRPFQRQETTPNLLQNNQRRKYPFMNDDAVVDQKFEKFQTHVSQKKMLTLSKANYKSGNQKQIQFQIYNDKEVFGSKLKLQPCKQYDYDQDIDTDEESHSYSSASLRNNFIQETSRHINSNVFSRLILANSNIIQRIQCPEMFDINGKLKPNYFAPTHQMTFEDEETPIFGHQESRQSREDYSIPEGSKVRKSLFGQIDENMSF